MATIKRNSGNQDYTNNADGFDISGGTTARKLTLTSGDISITGGGSFTHTFPSRTTTLLGTPSAPSVVSVGSSFSSTTVPTATLPGTHAANDILLLILQSSNDSNIAVAGYTQLGPQNAIGAASTAGTTKLSIFWRRDGGSEVAPTIPDSGDHTFGVMMAIRGCPTTGDPFHFLGNNWKFTASTTGTSIASGTNVDNCLVLGIFGHAVDSASAQSSGETNASLTSLTEQFDGATTDGTGGGILVLSGVKAAAGDINAFTNTWASSTVDVSSVIAFLPVDLPSIRIRRTEIQTFLGTAADLDDTWIKPPSARQVRAQLCDGGGGGSGGNTTTTAAGGGGGGGGGYAEAMYDASDLAASVTVHAGKGGAAGTALNQAGNPGVLSEFDKGNRGPLTSTSRIAGTAATAAASADGGNGGCGSGFGLVSPAVGTRISLEAATAGAAVGYIGGRGGNGTTAPVGGSPSVYGGGGGESGADTDAGTAIASNGYSLFGGGGGSSGRTNTNISGSGAGGGAAGVISAQGASGTDSAKIPYGGSGGVGGGSSVVTGGTGGFPGGGGGGGAGVAGGFGGRGGHGCVVVTTYF